MVFVKLSARKWAKDPLIHFTVLTIALFVIFAWRGEMTMGDRDAIVIDDGAIERLSAVWEAQTGRSPSPAEFDLLREDYLREEVLAREAIRLGLDRDDPIIRRRLVQKMQFILDDVAQVEPGSEEIKAWFDQNQEKFVEPATQSFRILTFQNGSIANQRADVRAASALEQLNAEADFAAWRSLGEPSLLKTAYVRQTNAETERLFGRHFAEALTSLETGSWQGPIPSKLAHHLIRIEARTDERVPAFSEISEEVTSAYLIERRRIAMNMAVSKLMALYGVKPAMTEPLKP